MDCTKIIIVVINVIFLIFGIAVLALGAVFKTSFDDIKDAFDDADDVDLKGNGEMLGLVLLVFGGFIVVMSLSGCIGAWCRNKCLLGIYGSVMLILLLAEVVCVALVVTNGFDVKDKLEANLKTSLKGFKEDLSNDKSSAWAALFETFDCCGITDPKADWAAANMTKSSDRTNAQTADFPVACCSSFNYKDDAVNSALFAKPEINGCLTSDTGLYDQGCQSKLEDWIDDHKPVTIGVGVAIFVLQLIIVIMAFCLMRKDDD